MRKKRWWWKKDKKEVFQIISAELSGQDKGDFAQVTYHVDGAKLRSNAQFRMLDPGLQGLIKAFFEMANQSLKTRNKKDLLRAWRAAQNHVIDRKKTNQLAYMSVEDHQNATDHQHRSFLRHVKRLFGKEKLISVDGQMIISTRVGGGWWYLKQLMMVVLNPVRVNTHVEAKEKNGKETIAIKKTGLSIDAGLFDDYVQITEEGIVISNADLGDDQYVIPWSQASTLIISSNASAYIDPVNSWILPMFRGFSQKPWVPFGTLTIKDRQSGNMLVTALMGHPAEFKDKLQRLIKVMGKNSVSPDRVDPVAPIELEEFITYMPGSFVEEIMAFLKEEVMNKRRRFRIKLGDDKNPGQQLFTFQGGVHANQDAMIDAIKAAIKKIEKEPDLDIKRSRKRALKDILQRIEPLAAGDILGGWIVKIMRRKFR